MLGHCLKFGQFYHKCRLLLHFISFNLWLFVEYNTWDC
uniref:Uncharacterized protein n=1 Tax=Rhizophora mucronata TaxID=61149 RepID=A0A2P2P3I9_RHIMU